jgi:hypothetical protein
MDENGQEPNNTNGDEPGAQTTEPKQTFSSDYVKDLRDESARYRTQRNDLQTKLDELQGKLATFETKQAEAEQKKLEEDGDLRGVIDQLREQNVTLSAQLQGERENLLRTTIGSEAGLPAELWGRIQGNDETEMRDDAKKLASLIAPQKTTTEDNGEDGGIDNGEDDATKLEPGAQARKPKMTTPNPGGKTGGRTREQRLEEYFGRPDPGGLGVFQPTNEGLGPFPSQAIDG